MQYRINKAELIETLKVWSRYIKRRIHLIACGGTAMTLLGVKESTKDIDFMVPNVNEYEYLVRTIIQLGYAQKTGSGWARKNESLVFDLFPGKRIHTTELLDSPLEAGRHFLLIELAHIYVGILNYEDLISSKLMRGASVDFEDSLQLVKSKKKEIDIPQLRNHFYELASYDIAEERVKKHWASFERILKKEGIYG